jgi:hypothetical protein
MQSKIGQKMGLVPVPCQNFVRAENIDIAGISGQASDS